MSRGCRNVLKVRNMDKTPRLEVPWKPGFSKRATSRSGEEGCTKWSPHSLMNFFSKSVWYKRHGYIWADRESQQKNRKDYATFQMLSGLKPTQSSTPLEALVKQQQQTKERKQQPRRRPTNLWEDRKWRTIQEVHHPSSRNFRRTNFNSPPTSLVQKNFFSVHKNVTLPLGPTHGITQNVRRSFKIQCKSQQD